MSLLERLTRTLDTFSHIELDDRSKVGALGEQYAAQVINEGDGSVWIPNPIIPHPTKPGYTREADFLVYTQGNLFCIEVKNYRGRISYPPRYPNIQVEQRGWLGQHHSTQTVIDGYDTSKILQEKMGKYGEGVFTKEHPNPLSKTQNFINHLKNYVGQIEPRFKRLHIIAVAGFSEQADISAIHSFDTGMIYVSEMPAFFEHHINPKFAQRPSKWIIEVMHKIPTWDVVQTTGNEWMNGILADRELVFKSTDRQNYQIPFKQIRSVTWKRKGFFSAHDEMTVQYINGTVQNMNCVNGEIRLNRIGEQQVHKLRNLNRLIVGVANKYA